MFKKENISILAVASLMALCIGWTAAQSVAQAPDAKVKSSISNEDISKVNSKDMAPEEPIKSASDVDTLASTEIKNAIERFKERDFDGALKILEEATKKDPDLPPAQIIMAQLFSQARIPLGVRSYLEQAAAEIPGDPEAFVIMGDLAVAEHRYVEAKMLYEKADELITMFQGSEKRKKLLKPRILGGLAAIDESQEKWADAQKLLEEIAKLEPTDSDNLQRLAHVMFMQQNASGALEKLKEAARIDPEMLTLEAVLAQFYEQGEDRENAKHWMAEALRVAPNDLRTHLLVGQWALQIGDTTQAQTQAAEAMKIDPNSLDAKVLSGVVALFQKDFPLAERMFESAHVQSPRNFAAANNLALVLAEQPDEAKRKRALEYAKGNIQQNPRSIEAASTYGWALFKNGNYDEAEKAFQAAVSGGAVGPDTAYYIACLSYERGRASQAKQWLDIALKTTGPFAMRKEAEELMAKLSK